MFSQVCLPGVHSRCVLQLVCPRGVSSRCAFQVCAELEVCPPGAPPPPSVLLSRLSSSPLQGVLLPPPGFPPSLLQGVFLLQVSSPPCVVQVSSRCRPGFFFSAKELKSSHQFSAHLPHKNPQRDKFTSEPVPSLITSCVEGTFPVHGTGRRSTSDSENALTMLHASRELHRRSHAALALPWKIMGTVSARAFANPRKNWEVSLDHLPLTSAARTTRRALPSAPRASSG